MALPTTAVDAAQAASRAAEAACVASPNPKAFEKAKAARRVLDDATRDLELATAHASTVEDEIATAERAAIAAAIAGMEASLTVVADEEALEDAVDLEVRSLRLRQRTEARCSRRISELGELNRLRARIGVPVAEVPPIGSMLADATVQIGEIALSARAQLGVAPAVVWLQWHAPRRSIAQYRTGLEELVVHRTMPDGTQETSGRDATHVVRRAAEFLERVEARRASPEKNKSSVASGVARAAVGALAAAAALTMVGG